MKKVFVSCIALLCIILYGCQTEALNIEETAKETKTFEAPEKGGAYNTSNSEGNELVILYPDGTTEAEKILKRQEYNIEDYKKCECADPNLELWIFDKGGAAGGGLEERKGTAKADEEIEGAEYNPIIRIQEDIFIDYGGIASTEQGLAKTVAANQGVTVAVLDTGIMYDYPGFTQPFLYNSNQNACVNNGQTEMFGWNFVEDNNNPYDNHYGRHGTIVTDLIMSKLDATNTSYQILPVKVANKFGNIRYFDALCGFQFAANKQDVDIINMSFGWYHQERELLQKFVTDVEDTILVVTSAGNSGVNTDQVAHFPSSYDTDNIIAVASLGMQNSGFNNPHYAADVVGFPSGNSNSPLADFSNRGQVTVDIAAQGQNIPFTYNNQVVYISGTSFSAALTTGYVGSLYVDGMSTNMLKSTLLSNCIYNPELHEIRYAKHIPQ
ncbi:S8 family peptidase [Kordia jejudonensis]|uniref:S8 family peptidase n=1 Tax=Kordia jejudonensis TaxID=1348245 RepID=UPI000628FC71|nr:S8 family serine peptidase [Kordia jejudonensis]